MCISQMIMVEMAAGDKCSVARSVTNSYASQQFHNHSSRQGDMPQVLLPFATDAKGKTLYEKMVEGKFLLGDGKSEPCMFMASCHDVQDRVE
jgi:hypothetical protein